MYSESRVFKYLFILNKLKEYLIKNQYSLGKSNVLTGLIFLFIGIILAQVTYWIYNVFMIIGIIGLIIGIALCSTTKGVDGK